MTAMRPFSAILLTIETIWADGAAAVPRYHLAGDTWGMLDDVRMAKLLQAVRAVTRQYQSSFLQDLIRRNS